MTDDAVATVLLFGVVLLVALAVALTMLGYSSVTAEELQDANQEIEDGYGHQPVYNPYLFLVVPAGMAIAYAAGLVLGVPEGDER